MITRRDMTRALLATAGLAAASGATSPFARAAENAAGQPIFKIAASTWSFHMQLWRGEMKAVEMPGLVRDLGIDSIEWTSKTFRDLRGGRDVMYEAAPAEFFRELRLAADDAGVRNRVLNAGGPFYLANVHDAGLQQALDFFLQWTEPAQILGSDILRVELYCNAPHGPDREAEAKMLAMEGLNRLLELTSDTGLTINVENHHGISSQPEWLADLIRSIDNPRLGLTADVNNFRIDQDMPYERDPDALPRYVDRRKGLEILMPLANWVSAKTYAFDSTGYELGLNYVRVIQTILDSGYSGYLSIEYEGEGEPLQGVRKSVAMLQKLRDHFS